VSKHGYFQIILFYFLKKTLKKSSAFGILFFTKILEMSRHWISFLLPSDQKKWASKKKVLTTTTTPFLQAPGSMILTLILCTII
jgi:hypothetical protein